MPEHEPLDYRLRCHSKRTDLPPDVLRDIVEAYEEMERLKRYAHYCRDMRSEKILEITAERDEARKEVCLWQGLDTAKTSEEVAKVRGWDCFEKPKTEQQKAMDRLADLDEELGLS